MSSNLSASAVLTGYLSKAQVNNYINFTPPRSQLQRSSTLYPSLPLLTPQVTTSETSNTSHPTCPPALVSSPLSSRASAGSSTTK